MQDKYSLAKCEQYGRRLATRLGQQFFGPQPAATLDGPALLQFTPVRQVNLLVVRQLLGRWQHEASQLRSPYFDFEAEPVRAALAQFMNVLSRHMRLDRAALEPLLAQATTDTLLLAIDPAAAFERVLLPIAGADPDEAVPLAALRDGLRYLDQSKGFFQGFVDSLPSDSATLDREMLRQRLAQYLPAHAKELPTVAQLVAGLSILLPITEADLWADEPTKPATEPPTPAAAEPAAPATERPASAPVVPAPIAAPATEHEEKAVPTSASTTTEVPLPPPPAKPASTAPASPATPSDAPLYEKLKATQPATALLAATLREAAHAGAPASLATRAVPQVGSLREGISINQRFSFINELFGGEPEDYRAAIEHLDSLPTAEAAQAYVRQELAAHHDWSRKEEHVAKLLKLLERKFAEA